MNAAVILILEINLKHEKVLIPDLPVLIKKICVQVRKNHSQLGFHNDFKIF